MHLEAQMLPEVHFKSSVFFVMLDNMVSAWVKLIFGNIKIVR